LSASAIVAALPRPHFSRTLATAGGEDLECGPLDLRLEATLASLAIIGNFHVLNYWLERAAAVGPPRRASKCLDDSSYAGHIQD
jgi:hypothetical protein